MEIWVVKSVVSCLKSNCFVQRNAMQRKTTTTICLVRRERARSQLQLHFGHSAYLLNVNYCKVIKSQHILLSSSPYNFLCSIYYIIVMMSVLIIERRQRGNWDHHLQSDREKIAVREEKKMIMLQLIRLRKWPYLCVSLEMWLEPFLILIPQRLSPQN